MSRPTQRFRLRIDAKEIVAVLFPLLFFIFGAVLILIGVTSYHKTRDTETWPTTAGTVNATRIRRYNDEGTIRFAPEIEYQYIVDGQSYNSSVIQAGIFVHFAYEDEAKRFLDKYTVGRNIQVFYDPTNPKDAVLEAKAAPVLHFVTLLGAVSCGFALLCYYSYYRGYRSRMKYAKSH
jgi:Protein of unknown function (DUF3592)